MKIDFESGAPLAGDMNVVWRDAPARGAKQPIDPIQVHAYDPHTFILRENRAVSFEAPFLYLLFGNERALLLDTGATADALRFPLRETVEGLIARWLAENPREGYALVVAHTHSHQDHVAADAQFAERPATTVVGKTIEDVQTFFGFTDWPAGAVQFDLGGRMLDVIASPGHHPAAITIYDPWSGFLLTGDNVYPGRLYARDMPAFVDSLDRVATLAEARAVTHVMGCHIEMTLKPGRDYPIGAAHQPEEPPLQMTMDQLQFVRACAKAIADKPGVHIYDDFMIYNGPCKRGVAMLVLRGLAAKLLRR
jgi:glyoxylase-like metal-dependent hydrolase (beta-lactamase superfamily II)